VREAAVQVERVERREVEVQWEGEESLERVSRVIEVEVVKETQAKKPSKVLKPKFDLSIKTDEDDEE
jgi:hypothetical protein